MTNERDIGILIGQLEGVTQRLDRADASRATTHTRIEALAADIGEVKRDISQMKTDMDEIKPEVALVRGLRMKAAGAVLVLGAIGALIGWAISSFGAALWAAINRTS